MKRVAIVQPNYVPWRGYFHLIASVDEFILLDDVQYTARDWRNRNLVKTADGVRWLTIPVHGGRDLRINEVEIADPGWGAMHLAVLTQAYRSAPAFERTMAWLSGLYAGEWRLLSDACGAFLERICAELGIATRLSAASAYGAGGSKSRRLLELCLAAGADEYVSGPAARSYLDEGIFARAGIAVRWFDYPYRPYPQLHGPYEPRLSILDLLLNLGTEAAALAPAAAERRDAASAVAR